jgi:hypothetical protein
MWKKLADWIAGIVRKELAELAAVLGKDTEEAAKRAESDLAAIKAHVAQELTKAKQELIGFNSTAFVNLRTDVRELKAHAEGIATVLHEKSDSVGADIHKYVDMSVADAKEFMNSEIWKRYETLVKDAAGAARIVDASKISMAICDVCHLATRRFAVSRINGNIICAGCAATGQK